MRRYWLVVTAIMVLILGAFAVVEAMDVQLLRDPGRWMRGGGAAAAAVGVGLLLVDVVVPVPSSLIMVAHGALFGVWRGALLSLAGSVGAALIAFGVGRAGGPLLGRLVSEEERRRADAVLGRWGALAIVVTRPVPILAETTAILAGASPMRWAELALAAVAGSLVPAVVYAVAGAMAVDVASGVLVFGGVLVVTGAFWLLGRRLHPGGAGPRRASEGRAGR